MPCQQMFDTFLCGILQVVCGGEHSMAITEGGKVHSWGRGSVGQTGHGNTETVNEPKLIQAMQHLTITQVRLPWTVAQQ